MCVYIYIYPTVTKAQSTPIVVQFNLRLVQICMHTPCNTVQDYLKPEWHVAYSLFCSNPE